MIFAVGGFSIPVFWLGFLMIYGFSVRLDLLPVQGYAPLAAGFGPFARHLILPTLTLGLIYMALLTRITRASVLEVLDADYVRTAHAKGQWPGRILFTHALKNAAVPIVTTIGVGSDAAHLGGGDHGERLRPARARASHRRRRPSAGLLDHPRGDAPLFRRLRGRQPSGGPVLPGARPADPLLTAALARPALRRGSVGRFIRRHPTVAAGGVLLVLMACVAVLAPFLLTVDPIEMKPAQRLRPPGAVHWFGTDMYGRDSYSRVIYGSRISLVVGLIVATITSALGLGLGVFAGFVRRLDGIVMRVMDGIMALPDLLLAITFVALTGASVRNVVIALVIPQTPRVVRLVRSVVLSLREQPFVEASVALGAGVGRTVLRHVLPNTLAPLIVQGTYVCASAVLIEAALSFLGAGTPPEIPSWGNIMAEARAHVRVAFWLLLFPGLFLASTVLSINLLGDGLRDLLDPRLARRM